MDRQQIAEHLALAERHVAEGVAHVARQRELIEEMKRGGHDIQMATDLLRTFEQTQASHVSDRDRLRLELSAPDASNGRSQ